MLRLSNISTHIRASAAAGGEEDVAVEAAVPGVAHYTSANSGARVLIRTLVENDVTVCFTNPGTSGTYRSTAHDNLISRDASDRLLVPAEMHFVAGLDSEPEMRPILVLQENVATGAADAYGRMTGVPASTLLHLAPGMGNGYANLHNARKNRTPLINIVGDHATFRESRSSTAPAISEHF